MIAGLTMIIGVAGALAQDDVKRILSFHVVSQIGYMIMGLGFFTVAGRRRVRCSSSCTRSRSRP